MPADPCPFCGLEAQDGLPENKLAVAFLDRFRVSPGHALVVTHRHVPDFFGCTVEERAALMDLVSAVKDHLDAQWPQMDGMMRRPDGYNVGFNAGEAAGQTVMHVHIHVIPRFLGDVEDPRGGVRHVIPHAANYLRQRAEILPDGDAGGSLYRSTIWRRVVSTPSAAWTCSTREATAARWTGW